MRLKKLELEKNGSRNATPELEIKVERANLEQAHRLITQLQKQLVERESNNLKQLFQQSIRLQVQNLKIKQAEKDNEFLKVICEVSPQKKPVVEKQEKQIHDLKSPLKQIYADMNLSQSKFETIANSSIATRESRPRGPSPVQSPKAPPIVPTDKVMPPRVLSTPHLSRPVVHEIANSKEQK